MAPAAPATGEHRPHHEHGVGAGRAVAPAPSARPWLAAAGVGVAAVGGCIALGLAEPSDGGPILCPFRALTGWDCPGCGMTRGLSQLLRGRVAAALDYNVALVVAVPILLYLYLAWLSSTLGHRLSLPRPGRRSLVALGMLVVVFTVVRNLPVGPGRYLNSGPAQG